MTQSIAREIGHSGWGGQYEVPDDELAVGSTLGGPRVATIVKATGALEKVYSVELGEDLFGTVALRHYDERTGMHLAQEGSGTFAIHPEHQEHRFTLASRVAVRETVFVLNGGPGEDGSLDPPAVYLCVRLTNEGEYPITVATYAFADLQGSTERDVVASYDGRLGALIAWNESRPDWVRVFGCSEKPASYETTLDYARSVRDTCSGRLSSRTDARGDPLGVLHLSHDLRPGDSASFYFVLTFSAQGRRHAVRTCRACPKADEALARTQGYYRSVLSRSVVLTPDPAINRGVLWAKANMLRVEVRSPTGWTFTNDPTRSNNSVGRDTAWFGFGSDYVTPEFSREALLAYVRLQQPSGKIVEYYDIRNGRTEDYGLNINDDTPLLILALWHHYNATGDERFLEEVYPAAAKAARYVLSQRDERGLVWCTADGTGNRGIAGWRNVIEGYRLSGATTEVNSECYAALTTVSEMARVLGRHDESREFADEAEALKEAINRHLYDPSNGLYYLHIDLDGRPRTDVTCDLVFPVMFGVAPDQVAARIVSQLSSADFWTPAGIRTAPRDSVDYTPDGGWGLLGGVWVGVSFWYAFAAARYAPERMVHALSASFRNYSTDPRRNNTVPGQFSEWLHGETLVNQGMMLSPWYPPRYLWTAIEGVGGLDLQGSEVRLCPLMAPDWKWLAVHNVPLRGRWLSWLCVRTPEVRVYTNFQFRDSSSYLFYPEDVTSRVRATGNEVCALGLAHDSSLVLFAGNTGDRTVTSSVRYEGELSGTYRLKVFDSLHSQWRERDRVEADELRRGLVLEIENKGFCLLDLRQES